MREAKAEEARRKREEVTELEGESRSPLVRFKGEYCGAVTNRESKVRYGQERVKSEQEPEIVDVIEESATQAISRENEANYVPKAHVVWWRKSWSIRFEDGPHLRTARVRRRLWRAVQPPELPKGQKERKGETDRKKWKSDATKARGT